jgi:hypothetical protein
LSFENFEILSMPFLEYENLEKQQWQFFLGHFVNFSHPPIYIFIYFIILLFILLLNGIYLLASKSPK